MPVVGSKSLVAHQENSSADADMPEIVQQAPREVGNGSDVHGSRPLKQNPCGVGVGGGVPCAAAGVGVGVVQTNPQPSKHPTARPHARTSVDPQDGGVHGGTAAGVGVDVGGVSPGRNDTVIVPAVLVASSRLPLGSLATTPEAKIG